MKKHINKSILRQLNINEKTFKNKLKKFNKINTCNYCKFDEQLLYTNKYDFLLTNEEYKKYEEESKRKVPLPRYKTKLGSIVTDITKEVLLEFYTLDYDKRTINACSKFISHIIVSILKKSEPEQLIDNITGEIKETYMFIPMNKSYLLKYFRAGIKGSKYITNILIPNNIVIKYDKYLQKGVVGSKWTIHPFVFSMVIHRLFFTKLRGDYLVLKDENNSKAKIPLITEYLSNILKLFNNISFTITNDTKNKLIKAIDLFELNKVVELLNITDKNLIIDYYTSNNNLLTKYRKIGQVVSFILSLKKKRNNLLEFNYDRVNVSIAKTGRVTFSDSFQLLPKEYKQLIADNENWYNYDLSQSQIAIMTMLYHKLNSKGLNVISKECLNYLDNFVINDNRELIAKELGIDKNTFKRMLLITIFGGNTSALKALKDYCYNKNIDYIHVWKAFNKLKIIKIIRLWLSIVDIYYKELAINAFNENILDCNYLVYFKNNFNKKVLSSIILQGYESLIIYEIVNQLENILISYEYDGVVLKNKLPEEQINNIINYKVKTLAGVYNKWIKIRLKPFI